jgi:hypothetical protein
MDDVKRCELCEREVETLTLHHLYPRSQGRRRSIKSEDLPTAWLCPACHRQLHALFSNRELARNYASIQQLRAEPKVQNSSPGSPGKTPTSASKSAVDLHPSRLKKRFERG